MLGDITVRYPILPFGIAVIRWTEADISRTAKTEARSGQIPPASARHTLLRRHELFSFFFFVLLLYLSPHLSLICHVFNHFGWRQDSHGYLTIKFISPSPRFAVFMSLSHVSIRVSLTSAWSALLTNQKTVGWTETNSTYHHLLHLLLKEMCCCVSIF